MMLPVYALPPGLRAPAPRTQSRQLGHKTAPAFPALPPPRLDPQPARPPENIQVPRLPLIPALAHDLLASAVPATPHRFLQFQPEFLLFIAFPPHFAVPCYSYTHRGHVGRPSTSWPHFLIKSRLSLAILPDFCHPTTIRAHPDPCPHEAERFPAMDKRNPISQGRIEISESGIGEISDAAIERRAREIALEPIAKVSADR